MRKSVAFVGLGKLGLPCAELLGQYHDVVGFDIRRPTSASFEMASSLQEAIAGKEFIFIAVPTPHRPGFDGSIPSARLPAVDFEYDILKQVLEQVARHAVPEQHVVVISTVLPGTCRRELLPIIGNKATLLYNPSFVAMGTVAEDFANPDIVTIGCDDGSNESTSGLITLYKDIVSAAYIHRGTFEEAESIKIFYNTFISLKIAFANMIQDVSEKLGNMNVEQVTKALGNANRRIVSNRYFTAGMGDGGPCHPRDNIALRSLSEKLNLGYDIFSEIIRARDAQAENMARYLTSFDLPVVIVGKTYKPGVPYVDGSSSMLVAHYVEAFGKFEGYIDFELQHSVDMLEPRAFLLAHSVELALKLHFPRGSVVVDPWRSCPPIEGCRVIHYGDTTRRSRS